MLQKLTQADLADILSAFERSEFVRIDLSAGSIQLCVDRAPRVAENSSTFPDAAALASPALGMFQVGNEGASAPLAGPGQRVSPDTVLGFIRARQRVTPVEAGRHGTIVEVLVRQGQFVEYGETLMRIEPEAQ